jgi:PAS domain S-box-containing protein
MNIAREAALLNAGREIELLVDPRSLAIADASAPTLHLLGYRREELLGRPITDIECSLADAFFWEDVVEGGSITAQNVEGSYRCASGDVLSAIRTVSRAKSRDGLLMVSAALQASAPRNEDQLATAASQLRATLEATADGILFVDCLGRIVNMNRKFARMWGLTDSLLIEHDDNAVFGFMAGLFPEPKTYQAALDSIAVDAIETFDFLDLADGRCFERKSLPARHGAKIIGRVFSFTDITARKQAESARSSLEAQLRESQKMQAIGTLAGGIAHDFNNILATILGNTELARQDVTLDPKRALESLEEIKKAGTRARNLVQQILSFSRRQPTERKPVHLALILKELARLLRATLPARVTLDIHCDADVPPVLADATQIEQIVINLSTNAMQAMNGEPGHIAIRLDTQTLDRALAEKLPALHALHEMHAGRVVRLTVQDDGSGMSAVTRDKIFEPFFTTKAVNEGTGLGLSVVHGIVEAHKGAIVVDSEIGKGTTFSLYLLPVGGESSGR